MEDPSIIDSINATGADFLLVALGARKGQTWLLRNMEALKVPVVSHLGATLNFLAGTVRRAPAGMRKLGLEWLWRIKEEPQSLTELRETEGRIAEFRERKLAAAARLNRIAIKAPISGDIYDLALHTIGGVIQPAETLMLITPEADELVLLAQVAPQDIDQIAPGQQARVRFQTFNQRLTPEVGAEVTQIAADTSRTDQNSPPFYAVRLRIPPEELTKLAGSKLKPGMPAEAFISTTERSPLSYLLKPLVDQIAHTFRE
ncbi:MAG: WecB/TagA/CpsF family glycosyltransferase, partial [Aestuariivirga sp.]